MFIVYPILERINPYFNFRCFSFKSANTFRYNIHNEMFFRALSNISECECVLDFKKMLRHIVVEESHLAYHTLFSFKK